jgi:DNA-binding response OmpR family regulator
MKGKVLIVDDDRAMCDLLDFDLRRRGFMVQWRNRAEDAFIQVKEADFDVVLADIHLPGMTGIELCERIAANRPDIPSSPSPLSGVSTAPSRQFGPGHTIL